MVTSPISERISKVAASAFYKAADPAKGDHIKVIRGRKVPIGTSGVIFWVGESPSFRPVYGRASTETRVGFTTETGDKHFVKAEYVEIDSDDIYSRMPAWSKIVADAHSPSEGEPDTRSREQAEADLAYWQSVNPRTMDYLVDFMRANAGEAKAAARIREIDQAEGDRAYLDPWQGGVAVDGVRQFAYHDESRLTYVLGGEFDEERVRRILSKSRTHGLGNGSSAGATDFTLISHEGNVITVERSNYIGD